ncbi:DUF6635 family protein [Rhodospirillaceae bacterium SYSU D60014]|uniref:DUF6635 family protein n=1 Tax=Virgifigura deserti TaxID=2268457 RepID=UPI000E66DF75
MDSGEEAASTADGSGRLPVPADAGTAAGIVDAAIARYCTERRARLAGFVDRHYSFRGAVRVHGQAFGWDLLRAPANLVLALPQLALLSAGLAGRAVAKRLDARYAVRVERLGHRLGHRSLFLKTDVAAEIEWLLYTDLLELPYRQVHPTRGERIHARDAIAEAILGDPRVDNAVRTSVMAIGHRARDPGFHARLADVVAVYVGSRVAASDIATSLVSIGVGALTARQFTPGMLTLGPAVAGAIAKHTAIMSFPLGAGIGGLWYGAFPVTAGPLLVAGVTSGLFMTAASVAAFAGILTDPVQRRLGIHRRRLSKLLAAIERELTDEGPMSLTLRDHYAARLLDLFDILRSAHRLAQ